MNKTLNKVELTGYASNPEVLTMKNGGKLFKVSLATHENSKNKNGEWDTETTWHNVIMWNDAAVKAETEITKGKRIHLMGKLIVNQYTDKDGIKRSAVKIQASEFDLVNEDAN